MYLIGKSKYGYSYELSEYWPDCNVFVTKEFAIFVCPACHQATITLEEYDSEHEYEITDATGELRVVYDKVKKILYPKQFRSFEYVPDEVIQSYEQAARLLSRDPLACAIFVGRTLEFLCKDRQASGGSLDKMLRNLADKGEISPSILDLALSLKSFRNLAAHATLVTISQEDAELFLKICEVIIEYVYEVTQMLKDIKQRLETPE